MEKWNVLSSEYVIDDYPYTRIRKDRCQLAGGITINAYFQEYPNWVNAVVLTPRRELVLVKQYRHGVGDFTIEVPGGIVDEGEEPQAAIVREVSEETGYRSAQSPVLLGAFHPNPATSNNKVITYLLLDATQAAGQSLDATEEIEIQLVPFDTFGEMIRSGQAPQIFSAMSYYLAKEYLANR